MRIPASVRLPFGYVVAVKLVSDTEMADVIECEPDEAPDGSWDVDTRTIYLRKVIPLGRKRYALGHELGHALWDWQHHCLDEGAMKP